MLSKVIKTRPLYIAVHVGQELIAHFSLSHAPCRAQARRRAVCGCQLLQ